MIEAKNPLMVIFAWYEGLDKRVQEGLSAFSNRFMEGIIIPEYVKSLSELELNVPLETGEKITDYHESVESYVRRRIREFKTAFGSEGLSTSQIVQRTFLLRTLISACLSEMDTGVGGARMPLLSEQAKIKQAEREGVSSEPILSDNETAAMWSDTYESWNELTVDALTDDRILHWHRHDGFNILDYEKADLKKINQQFEAIVMHSNSILKQIKKAWPQADEAKENHNTILNGLSECRDRIETTQKSLNNIWDDLHPFRQWNNGEIES